MNLFSLYFAMKESDWWPCNIILRLPLNGIRKIESILNTHLSFHIDSLIFESVLNQLGMTMLNYY